MSRFSQTPNTAVHLGLSITHRRYRATASTNMNATSSRSHAVFIVNLTQTEHDDEIDEEHTKVSRINLIDLAGKALTRAHTQPRTHTHTHTHTLTHSDLDRHRV